ncbi:ATP-binding protein [Dolichospermum sp. LEGE 00246]|uniref:ATP-binding protein n=1 Tax=Dolichospermum sp. LEGE 00246 TaxID=1828605 RepID=UPI0018802E45|nr:ATP-binding protein [Dolichospermum sp. LEGE 00246]MBE9258512.1 ATP-binding protein [Dolichospermum sp. LEGE 00246]
MTNNEALELKRQVANTISFSLLYSLQRQHLDAPFVEAVKKGYFKPAPFPALAATRYSFLQLEQVGSLLTGDPLHYPLTAIQTVLTACHDPNYKLVFIVSNDGTKNHIYLGVVSFNPIEHSPELFAQSIGNFIQGNWIGTRMISVSSQSSQFQKNVLNRFIKNQQDTFNHGMALTGIPSLKLSEDRNAYPQSLDRLISGLRGSPFMYMVIADPILSSEVESIIFDAREIMAQIHSFTKISYSEALSKGFSEAYGTGKNSGKSTNNGTTTSKSSSDWKTGIASLLSKGGIISEGVLPLMLAGTAITTIPFFAPALFCFSILAAAAGDELAKEFQTSTSEAKSETENSGESESYTKTSSDNLTQTFGQEYINTHAQAAEKYLQQHLDRFEKSRATGGWNVGVYLLTKSQAEVNQAATQLRGLLTGQNSVLEPIRIHNLSEILNPSISTQEDKFNLFKLLQNFAQLDISLVNPKNNEEKIEHPLGTAFNGLTTPLSTDELALLINFPQREVPGVRVMPTTDFSLNPPVCEGKFIELGEVLEGGTATTLKYPLALDALNKHGLITGITGSGKTVTTQKIIKGLQNNNIPFLIIEPAKREYVTWAENLNKTLPEENQIIIYEPGSSNNQRNLSINPFDFISQEQILSHIDRLKSILNATFPMQEVLPMILENLLFSAYKATSWIDSDPRIKPSRIPNLSYLLQLLENDPNLIHKNYEEKIKGNIVAALTTRINSLCLGWKEKLFNQESTPWAEIFDRNVVINLSHLGDDNDKALAMAVLFLFLYEYRQDQHEHPEKYSEKSPNLLHHLTIIEEAHRILLKSTHTNFEQANPQGKVAEMFASILSEIRAYGEGLLIIDQVPSRLIPDAIKNTNFKIVHRLVATDDRDAMSASMSLNLEQSQVINKLRTGQAIVYGELDDMAAWIQVTKS